jgi:hypothetical protein
MDMQICKIRLGDPEDLAKLRADVSPIRRYIGKDKEGNHIIHIPENYSFSPDYAEVVQ